MAIRSVLKMGEPLLLQVAKPIERFDTPELRALIRDMEDTMEYLSGAGLAAPQIGESLQIVIFGFDQNPRYPRAGEVPFTVLINPQLTPLSDELEDDWEGCLSVPGMRGMVPRYKQLRYQGFDQYGNAVDRTVSGFHARVVQHECDHLQGILYPMRIRNFQQFGFTEALFPGQGIVDDQKKLLARRDIMAMEITGSQYQQIFNAILSITGHARKWRGLPNRFGN